MFEGRITNAGANNPTGTQADAPFSLIENLVIEGFHRPRNQKEQIYNARGSDLRELCRIYSSHEPLVLPAPGFNSTPNTALSTLANAVNDVRFVIDVPFTMENLSIRQQLGWLLDAPNYDSLTLRVQFSDDKSVFTGQTSASTFSAFGSTTGSPRVRVLGNFAMGGSQKWAGFIPGRIFRTFIENISGDITQASVSQSRQFAINRGYRIRSLLMKTGVKSTAATAGNNVYNTVSDTVYTNIKVNRGLNRLIRFLPDFNLSKEIAGFSYGGLRANPGYALLDFAAHGAQSELLDTTGLVAGPSGDTDVALFADIAGGTNFAALMLTQEARYLPAMQKG